MGRLREDRLAALLEETQPNTADEDIAQGRVIRYYSDAEFLDSL